MAEDQAQEKAVGEVKAQIRVDVDPRGTTEMKLHVSMEWVEV